MTDLKLRKASSKKILWDYKNSIFYSICYRIHAKWHLTSNSWGYPTRIISRQLLIIIYEALWISKHSCFYHSTISQSKIKYLYNRICNLVRNIACIVATLIRWWLSSDNIIVCKSRWQNIPKIRVDCCRIIVEYRNTCETSYSHLIIALILMIIVSNGFSISFFKSSSPNCLSWINLCKIWQAIFKCKKIIDRYGPWFSSNINDDSINLLII